jgi:polysaccharide deacetylase 2 family uncharacterized protein YibQ
MGRGFISGTLWGAVVGAFIILAATQVAVRQDLSLPQPEDVASDAPDASEFAEVIEPEEPQAPAPDTAPGGTAQIAEAPAVAAPVTDMPPATDASPLAAPAPVSSAPAAPEAPGEAPPPQVAAVEGAPAPRIADAPAPDQPASDAPLVSGLDAPAPPVEDTVIAAASPPQATPAPPPVVSDAAPTPPPIAEAPDEGALTPAAPEAAEVPTDPAASPGAAAPPDDAAPRIAAPAPNPTPNPATPDPAPAETDQAAAPSVSSMPGQRAAPLPGIADADPAPEAAPEVPTAAETPDTTPPPTNALEAFRAPFEATAGQPIVALVLLVPATAEAPVEALAALPFPASFAIDALSPEARDTATALRAAGRELLLIPSLPAGATPSDVEVALQANLTTVPEAVAFIDGPDASFQADRTAVAQVVAAAGATGHGMVTFPRGLNTAQQIARRDGVPSSLVFRDIDGEGQDPDTIRRTLDQAAFRARQEGAVILVGRARPATLAALTEWALGNRAASVSLAPVSAAILATQE